jgi:release factor glutamine methyltransferase
LTIQEYKTDFQEKCKQLFSKDEIQSFWQWFKENLDSVKDETLTEKKYNTWLNELLNGKPIQYIFGYSFFHKYCYKVSSDTLIPRPETEELCELILKENTNTPLTGIDIGTGSGCIPITLLCERSNWNFNAIDISEGALKIADINAKKYQISDRIILNFENFLENSKRTNHYDIIVSNPPYIHPNESHLMEPRVTKYEPHIALFVNEEILEFYTALFHFFENNTNPNAQLWMETHQEYCNDVVELFNKKFRAKKIEDLSKNPRFVYVVK